MAGYGVDLRFLTTYFTLVYSFYADPQGEVRIILSLMYVSTYLKQLIHCDVAMVILTRTAGLFLVPESNCLRKTSGNNLHNIREQMFSCLTTGYFGSSFKK